MAPTVRLPALSGAPSQSTLGAPNNSTSPRAFSSSHSSNVTSIGVPFRNRYAVIPLDSPVPIGSQTWGSGKSASNSSTVNGQLSICRSSSYNTM